MAEQTPVTDGIILANVRISKHILAAMDCIDKGEQSQFIRSALENFLKKPKTEILHRPKISATKRVDCEDKVYVQRSFQIDSGLSKRAKAAYPNSRFTVIVELAIIDALKGRGIVVGELPVKTGSIRLRKATRYRLATLATKPQASVIARHKQLAKRIGVYIKDMNNMLFERFLFEKPYASGDASLQSYRGEKIYNIQVSTMMELKLKEEAMRLNITLEGLLLTGMVWWQSLPENK